MSQAKRKSKFFIYFGKKHSRLDVISFLVANGIDYEPITYYETPIDNVQSFLEIKKIDYFITDNQDDINGNDKILFVSDLAGNSKSKRKKPSDVDFYLLSELEDLIIRGQKCT